MNRLALVIAGVAIASRADAANPDCSTLQNPVYLQVGDTQTNLMKNKTGSMSGTGPFFIPSTAEDPTWTPAKAALTCNLPVGQLPDIANSALFNSSCTAEAPPSTVTVTNGPIQAYVMAVPQLSDQEAITAEEAYFVFGFGAMGMISPWTDISQMFIRTTTKSTLLTWAAN